MLKLAAFADEISPDLDEQVRTCKQNGVTHFELRGVAGKNVLDFDAALRNEIKSTLADNGLGVISIASPIGKVAIDRPWSEHLDRFKLAVELAEFFEAPFIRVFSYYPAGGEGKGPIDPHRAEIIERFLKKVEHVQDLPVTLVHENEKGIFGDTGKRCADLMSSVESPKLRCAFDFANFVQVGERPLDNWPTLKRYTAHIHIKDARRGDGVVVPAGHGDGHIAEIVADAYAGGYRGFLSLEPHLKVAGHSHGETGSDLFKVAADALKQLCRRINVPLAGEDATARA
ncbi:MAG TPA: sugar phosphate isomerase/epimerase family protein [Tepidisphaeraceae bacterium]|nr:sugar phosphate isomerase/epimerase family protein [Tepidisphaeraceae bacterium]